MFLSLTRLRLRSVRFLPGFAWYAYRSAMQLRDSPGYLQGATLRDAHLTFWTASAWIDASAMKAYRGSAAHARAMPKLAHWCDEASVAHWELPPGSPFPTWPECHTRMTQGRASRVNHPSPDHLAFHIPVPPSYLRNAPLPPARKPD